MSPFMQNFNNIYLLFSPKVYSAFIFASFLFNFMPINAISCIKAPDVAVVTPLIS